MSKLSFHGASGTVTGSCFLLEDTSTKTLIDCGLFQGPPSLEAQNHEKFSFDPVSLTSILLTHAHLDHCGRLGILIRNGFNGPIYMTAATKALIEIALMDAAHIMSENRERALLYSKDDVEKLLTLVKIIEIDKDFKIPGYSVNYVNAGHILGSASIVLTRETDGRRFVFSGDLGNSPQDLIDPTEYVLEGDVCIMETTYGDSLHPKEDATLSILKEINAIEEDGGVLLIPSFSLERTQEILHKIDHLKRSSKVLAQTPVYLDSPMAIAATEVFRKFNDLYNTELKEHETRDDPFSFPGLQVIYHAKESEKLSQVKGPKVIIAGSGMMTGGRIVNHAKTFLPMPSTHILFAGYQGENTLGRAISSGEKQVKIGDETIDVRANVSVTHSMSSHADQAGLLKWFKKINGVKQLFLIHGEDPQRETFADLIQKENKDLKIFRPYKEEQHEI